MEKNIALEKFNNTALVKLNRPKSLNAINYELIDEMVHALTSLNNDSDCLAIVITGSGNRAFCAGMDIDIIKNLDPAGSTDWMIRLKKLYESVRFLDKPCVAAINGVAAGAGYQLALLADIRVGHTEARMGQTEINVGLASLLGPHLMSPFLGHAKTVELTLSGKLIDGNECHRLGLFNYLVEEIDVLPQALVIAQDLTEKPKTAMRLTKQRFREDSQAGFDKAFETAIRLQKQAYESGEPQKVMANFFRGTPAP